MTSYVSARFMVWFWWAVISGAIIGTYLGGYEGVEWRTFRTATYNGFMNMPNVANPPYAALLLYPLVVLPFDLGSMGLRIISAYGFHLAAKTTRVDRWLLLCSFPACWLLWFNQLDGLVLLGVILGYIAIVRDKPLLQGAATLLLLIKPHIGAPLALYYLWRQRHYQAFIVSGIAISGSFVLLGFWPVAYIQALIGQANNGYILSHFAQENVSLYPWGLLLWPVAFIPMGLDRKILAILAITMLSSPYMPSYSLVSLMAFPMPIWGYLLISSRFIVASVVLVQLALLLLLVWIMARVMSLS